MNFPFQNDQTGSHLAQPPGDPDGPRQRDAEGDEFDLRAILVLLRRRARLIAATFVVIVAGALIATLAMTPTYTASTLILFDPSRKNLLEPSAQGMASPAADNARVDSEVEILRSDGLLMQVIQSENLTSDPEFGGRPGIRDRIGALLRGGEAGSPSAREASGKTLDRLRSRVTIERRRLTYLIAVSVRSESPDKAASLADAIARTYIAHQLDGKVSGTLAARDAIREQLAQARTAVVRSETAFSDYIVDNLAAIAAATGRDDLERMRAEIETLDAHRSETAGQAETLRAHLNAADWDALARNLQSEAARDLQHRRTLLLSSGAGTQEELAEVEGALAREAGETLDRLRTALARDDAAIAAARQRLGTTILDSNLPPDTLAHLYGLRQEARNSTSTYQTLLARLQALETEASLQLPDSRIVSAAVVPVFASFPDRALIVAFAGIVALGAGIALAFLFENYIGGFTTAAHVETALRRRIGTVLPETASEADAASLADIVTEAPLSRYAEAVRRLRVMLDTALRPVRRTGEAHEPKGSVIMVSSALGGEGKTTLSVALARTYAASGQRVLLLDCDLRKPGVHRHLNVESSTGLIDVLNGNMAGRDLSGILVGDPKSPLTAIVGARHADLPTDQLIPSRSFGQIVASARQRFDYVILDSPPVEPVVDGLYLSQYADAVVFVIRWARTPQRIVVGTVGRLAETMRPGTHLLVALNRQEGTAPDHAGKHAGYDPE